MKLFGLSMTAMLLFACGEKEETTEPSTEPALEPSGEPSEEVTDTDEDGIPAEEDCDDADADLGAVAEDGDCDGILTADDCDDEDDSSNAIADDADCDGVLTADDCDDADATSTVVAEDADCDGTLTADDCDDDNAGSTIVAEDGDCDGVPTEEDCDDADSASTIQATDEDCDGVETTDDCDDTDSSSTVVADDGDCDGVLTADDCDDTDSGSTVVAEDADCDGTLTADDCDDTDSASTIVADDGDCDTVLTADDCDDTDASSTTIATDADCDTVLTADDCDDTDASSTTVATDGDCDGFLTANDCNDSNAAINPNATEIWYNGDDDDCSGNASDYDQDGDGEDAVAHGGADCNDTDANSLNNTYYIDADADGYGDSSTSMTDCSLPSGYADNADDCNDDPNNGGAASNPGAVEVWYNGDDNDCSGNASDYDQDGDGQDSDAHGGTDCQDTDATAFSGATEIWYDGIDNACDGGNDFDQDGDGEDSDQHGGVDCDDTDPDINTSADDGTNVEDGIDDNCDGIADEAAFLDITVLSAGDLIITEVMPDPVAVSDANGEWFEIYNDTGVGLNLQGLGFMDDGSDDFTVSGTLYLPAGEYMVFGKNADTSTNGGVDVDYEYDSGMGLTNSSDELYIYTSTDFIDSIEWDNGATFPNPSGASIALDPGTSAADNDSGFNWCEGTSAYGDGDLGTPGAENDACPPPLTWSADIQPILQSYSCTGCHSSRMPDLSTILTIQAGDRSGSNSGANMPWITAGDPSQSYLLHKVMGTQGSVGGGGGTMPQGGSMSQSDIDSIELWINQGAN